MPAANLRQPLEGSSIVATPTISHHEPEPLPPAAGTQRGHIPDQPLAHAPLHHRSATNRVAKALTDHRTHAHAFLAVESPYRRVLAAHAQTDRVEVIADPIAPSLTRLLTRRCIEPSVHHHAQHGD